MPGLKHNGPAVVSPALLPRQPHVLPVNSVVRELGVDPSVGLNDAEIERRLRFFGRNLLTTRKPVSDLALLARQLASPVMALLAAAMALSFSFGEWEQVCCRWLRDSCGWLPFAHGLDRSRPREGLYLLLCTKRRMARRLTVAAVVRSDR